VVGATGLLAALSYALKLVVVIAALSQATAGSPPTAILVDFDPMAAVVASGGLALSFYVEPTAGPRLPLFNPATSSPTVRAEFDQLANMLGDFRVHD